MIKAERTLLEKLNRLIDDHLDDPSLTIETICQALGVSRSQLHRAVKEESGRSVTLYIRWRRLQWAKEMLVGTDLRVSEICDAVGIGNLRSFSTYFSEEFQISPTQYRKSNGRSGGVAPDLAAETVVPSSHLPHPASSTLSVPPSSQPVGFGKRRGLYASVAVGLLLVTAGLYVWFENRHERQPIEPTVSSLAVLPFTNLGTADGNPACESIMDHIYTSVALIDNLNVIARSSSDKYRDTQKGILQIGGELRATNVLKGSFLKTEDQIQIKIELIGTKNSGSAWTKNYHTAYKNIFQLTDQIVTDVARQLERTRSVSATEKLQLARPRDLEAYNAFLQGRQLMNTRTKIDLLAGIERLDRAIALDSAFAEAYACKAAAIHLLPTSGPDETARNFRQAEQTALDAIRIEPTNSTAYAVLGSIYHATYQWQAAENAFRIALQHNPDDAQANYWYSLMLRSTGRVREAVGYSSRAVTLDPLYPIMLAGHILNCVYANKIDLAKQNIENGRVLFDNSFSYHMVIGYYHIQQKEYDQAIAEIERAIVLNPDDRGQISVLMYCEAKRGNRQKADAFIQGLVGTSPWDDYQRAVVYAGLSKADSSLYYLKKAADGGYYFRDTKVSPVFEPYHSSLAFRAVLRRYNLAD